MPGASVPDAAQAFEFQDDWSLTVAATRYQLEAVKHTSIERGLIRAVVTRGGQVAVQALYRMRSSGQRLAVTLPSGVEFDTEPLRIDGKADAAGARREGRVFRAAGRPRRRSAVSAGASLHAAGRRRPRRLAGVSRRAGGAEGVCVGLFARGAGVARLSRPVDRRAAGLRSLDLSASSFAAQCG